jgi:hypothetical protein
MSCVIFYLVCGNMPLIDCPASNPHRRGPRGLWVRPASDPCFLK